MHHKLLLGSTALVGAGVLFAGMSPAQAQIEIVVSGFTEVEVIGASGDTLTGTGNDRNYTFAMDNELHVRANGETEGGTKYGSKVEIELGSGSAPGGSGNAFIDEVGLFFSGGFGRVELGRDDGAEDVMFLGGEDAQAGTGGIDGDTRNLGIVNVQNTGDTTKATYFTPRIAGFQVGASFTPDTGDNGGTDNNPGDFENNIGAGVNWVGNFGAVDLTLSAVGIIGKAEVGDDDRKDYSIGGFLSIGGFDIGATWGQRTDANEADFINLGVKYNFGNAAVSVGYNYANPDAGDSMNIFAVSGNMGLMPGVTLKGDVSYNTDDPQEDAGSGDTDSTVSGVLSIQMDY